MADIERITLNIGVPQEGTPTVYRVTVWSRDSAGPVEHYLQDTDKKVVLKAVIGLLEHLIE